MTIAALFQQAVQAFQSRNYAVAEQLCQQINQHQPQADVLHMLALCARQRHDTAAAERYFQQSLTLQPQPTIRANYANFLVSEQRYSDAVVQFEILNDAKQLNVNSAQQYIWVLSQLGNLEQALATAIAELKLAPTNATLLFQVGQLYRQLGQPERALDYLNQACTHVTPVPVRYLYALACTEYDVGHEEAAEQRLQMLIDKQPDLVEAHQALNQLYWETGAVEKFGRSFIAARKQRPDSLGLLHAEVSQYILIEQFEQASDIIQAAPHSLQQDYEVMFLAAILEARRGNQQRALELCERLIATNPYHLATLKSLISMLIQAERYTEAQTYLTRARELEPLNQELLAYQALVWRLTDDPQWRWLDNPEFIQAIDLPLPAGYNSTQTFMADLADVLSNLHRAKRQPLDQSVRNGSQTMGYLLGVEHPLIQAFKASLTEATCEYLASLPDDSEHPFLSRKQGVTPESFRFTGAWSVKLDQQGFHTNHVHSQGWLSCCSYIQLPAEINPQDVHRSGWIKFGETSLNLGKNERIQSALCPKVGQVVFFPSYFWHGTVPLEKNGVRMTAPVDISPV